MSWPDDGDLPVEVEAAFGSDPNDPPGFWLWTDLSGRLVDSDATIRPGTATDGRDATPGTCTVDLLNNDGALTPQHPMSPYWPNVEVGVPFRVRLRRVRETFTDAATNGWGFAEGGTWSVMSGPSSAFSVSGGVGFHTHTAVNTLRRIRVGEVSLTDCEQVIDVAPPALMTGAALVTGMTFRETTGPTYYWLRCEFKAGGTQVMLKISRCVNGTFSDLAVLDPVPGLVYSAGAYLRVRAAVQGSNLMIKAWRAVTAEPRGWQLTAVDWSITGAGRPGVQSWVVTGNTNTLPVQVRHQNYAVRVERFSGFADQWEPGFAPTNEVGQAVSVVSVTASGILRRLSQGASPLRSALYRAIMRMNPTAYWPLEDPEGSTGGASAVPDVRPMQPFGYSRFQAPITGTPIPAAGLPKFATGNDIPGSLPVPDLRQGGTLVGYPPIPSSGAQQWRIGFVAVLPRDRQAGGAFLVSWTVNAGTYDLWEIQVDSSGIFMAAIEQVGFTAGYGTNTVNVNLFDGLPHYYEVEGVRVGSTLDVRLYVDDQQLSAIHAINAPSLNYPAGWIDSVIVNPKEVRSSAGEAPGQPQVGHIAVWQPVSGLTTTAVAMTGHTGETATNRIFRLCEEENVTLSIVPAVNGGQGTPMGAQAAVPFLDLIGDCVEADMGLLYEEGYGLAYMPRKARYNQPTRLTVDLAAYRRRAGEGARVLVPVYNDSTLRNQWTIDRRNGASGTFVDTTSTRRHGVYGDGLELNLAWDDQLLDQARWRVHLGTVLDLAESSFPIDVAANPTLMDGWLSCRVGSRVVRTNPPAPYRPGSIDRLVMGWTETLGRRTWSVQVVPALAAPWDIAVVSDKSQRVTTTQSTLGGAVTATATTLLLTSTAGMGLWTTRAAAFPLDLNVGGEQIRVSAITGASSPQTATVAPGGRSLNGVVKAHAAGTPVTVWQPAVVAL